MTETAITRRRIVLDCDTGLDDTLTLIFLSGRPDVELVAVGTVHGNVSAVQGAHNSAAVLKTLGRTDVPVTVGARHPLAQPVQYSAKVHGSDGLGEIPIDREVRVRTDISAAEQLVQLARQHPGELEIIATGPLTNIALALMIEPELPNLIAGISVMGGAVTVPGNNTPWAESNIKHDPEAASLVFSAGWRRCVLAGLDVTLTTWLRSADLAAIDALTTPAGRLAQQIIGKFSAYFSVTYGRQSCPIHDPTAAILLLHPEYGEYGRWSVQVELAPGLTRGATLADRRPFVADKPAPPHPPIEVATRLDLDRLLECFVAGIRAAGTAPGQQGQPLEKEVSGD
ncbi:nucleoside hydrolase [Streptomyces sp. NEAU-YJ-81]|uniref:nucleoside hydrolase n=1 Tax=Streptomyces sp. NEAU-YJ-81 TaxID=2820288 RepID=UPI001ABCEB3B|nr:nucleoside hydrolase [Streptomyces sp. NEAU-YJ-81]MBO3681356.1 nucleoside hydrolase [Streptomyces sp. NEAU-YJ-81]